MSRARRPRADRVVTLTRFTSDDDADRLKARLIELGSRGDAVHIDGDGGTVFLGEVHVGSRRARVIVDHWIPSGPARINITAKSAKVVAKVVAKLWPDRLTVDNLLLDAGGPEAQWAPPFDV